MIEKAVRELLLSVEEVTDLVGTRVYPSFLPQETTLPAIVYRKISIAREGSHAGHSGLDHPRFQFSCIAESYRDAKLLAAAVVSALDYAAGIWADQTVYNATVDTEIDIPPSDDTGGTHQVAVDAVLWYSTVGDLPIFSFSADGRSDGELVGEDVLGFIRQRADHDYPTSRIYTTGDAAAGHGSSAYFETGAWATYADLVWFSFWEWAVSNFAPGIEDFDFVACLKSNSDGWIAVGVWGTRGGRVHNVDFEIDAPASEIDFYVHDGEHGLYGWSDSVSVAVDFSQWWWVRIRKRADIFSARVWQDGDPEPSSWDIEDFDARDEAHGGGGLRHLWINAIELYFDHSTNAEMRIQEMRIEIA